MGTMKRINLLSSICTVILLCFIVLPSISYSQKLHVKNDRFKGQDKTLAEKNNSQAVAENRKGSENTFMEVPDTDGPKCSKFGPDSNRTLDEASLYSEYYKSKNYFDAIPHWRYIFDNAPGYHYVIHSNGINMYRYFIENESDSTRKETLIDTLVLIYRKRIECFGKEGFLLGRLGYDLMKYRPKQTDVIRQIFMRSIEISKENSEYFILYPYIKLEGLDLKKGVRDTLEMFKIYETIIHIAEANADGDNGDKYQEALNSIVDELKSMGILVCDNLKPFYLKKFIKDKDNPKVWKDAAHMLSKCKTCDPTFQEMWKNLFEIQPSSKLATKIAVCESRIGDTREALGYFDKAIELEEDSVQKAKLAYSAGLIVLKEMKNFPKSREYCRKAIEYNPNWGEPYMLIANLYASSGKMCDPTHKGVGFAAQVVVWPAIDKWKKAKMVDPNVAAEANKKIAQYSQYLPERAEIFNRGIKEGSSYTVGCWINEVTKVRVK